MKANNINKTSQNICKCGSWLNHWKNFSGRSLPKYCPEKACMKVPELVHMFKKAIPQIDLGILFLCAKIIMQ
jgi:predicted nucleotidyltransferase